MTENAESLFQQVRQYLTAVPTDYAAALPLLEKAAEAGHAEAAFQLGGCMQYGMGTEPNRVQATYWLRKAAEGGHTTARYNLALLREDNGVPVETVIPAYLSLAEEGHTDAQVRVMHYYAEKQDERAVHWAQQAAKNHHPQAQIFLARHYQHSKVPNLPAAHQLYQQAAAQGIVSAHWQLANQFLHGQGVPKNHKQALYHLRIAAEADVAPAQAELGKLLLEGRYLPADAEEGMKWINKAVRQEDDAACAFIAKQYLTGEHIGRDYKKAALYAAKAARHNQPDALCLLGDIRQYGLGIQTDLEKAREYYEHAVKYGSLVAMQRLLMLDSRSHVDNPAYNQEVLEFQQSLERNYQSGFALHYGIGVAQDFESAFAYYSMAARNGHPKAQTNLGMMYYNGEGVEADAKLAARWFTQAATQGDTTAQYNLACLHYSGTGVPQDTEIACKWLQTAIDSGHDHPEELRRLMEEWQAHP
ncbi:tetratricopeptide repeat protein [Neisseria sp. 23W00296]|uniref:tetratricopeptide repeat protein n=1 Tax=unclassified Neisseria TaxID=2623750 RepID=UPI0037571C73